MTRFYGFYTSALYMVCLPNRLQQGRQVAAAGKPPPASLLSLCVNHAWKITAFAVKCTDALGQISQQNHWPQIETILHNVLKFQVARSYSFQERNGQHNFQWENSIVEQTKEQKIYSNNRAAVLATKFKILWQHFTMKKWTVQQWKRSRGHNPVMV